MTDQPISLVALDIAGTTVSEEEAVYAALREAVQGEAGAPVSDDALDRWKGASKRQAVEGLLGTLGGPSDPAAVDRAFADFTDRLLGAYDDQPPQILPGVAGALAQLRSAGVKVVLQTGYSDRIARALLGQVGWSVGEDIDALVTSDEVPFGRPAPYLIFRSMERAGVHSVEEVLVGGDTVNDLRAGTNAGVRFVVGVLTGAHDVTALGRERHTHLLGSVAELPRLLE